MADHRFETLRSIKVPASGEGARERAHLAAMDAFDSAQAEKDAVRTQGSGFWARLRSIRTRFKGWTPMDARVPVAATVTALLLLPLGIVLMNQTALTPPRLPPMQSAGKVEPVNQEAAADREQMTAAPAAPEIAARAGNDAPGAGSVIPAPPAESAESLAPSAEVPAPSPAPMAMTKLQAVGDLAAMPVPESGGDRFASFDDNPVKSVATDPVSTFSTDVDTSSYAYVRRMLESGILPPPDAVRTEELVNYFNYSYPLPQSPDAPFAADIQVLPSPFDAGKRIMRIGLQGYEVPAAERDPVNLVFLIDTSGSMQAADKLPLLRGAFRLLIDQLNASDTISIVTYAGAAGTALAPTPASDRRKILDALDNLSAGGSTAGAAGIEAAYDLAQQNAKDGVQSQVILATDGDFNVGASSTKALTDLIAEKRDAGITLSVLGFGTGNLNDSGMQALAQNGNGTAHYIDSLREAQRVLVNQAGAVLTPIASDVKVQVEFNPAQIAEYRLIGYETRALDRADFNNDRVDAGDVGSGLSVTALYELTPVGSGSVLTDPLRYGDQDKTASGGNDAGGELAFFKLRYKLPGETRSRLYTEPVTPDMQVQSLDQAGENARFALAVAGFGQKLRHVPEAETMSYEQIRQLAAGARGADPDGARAGFLSLVDLAGALSGGEGTN